MIYSIIAVNTLVFLAFRIPKFQPFLNTHFLHYPTSNKYYTLLTSVFSHKDLWHLVLNMFALKSFATISCTLLGPEQFLAFYLTSGIFASLGRRTAISLLPKFYQASKLIPSLGASGAIFSLVGYTAYHFPEAKANIMFLPFLQFDLQWMLAAFMLLDLTGIVRGWRAFDHFAHLTGASVGLMYAKYGKDYIWIPLHYKIIEFKKLLKRIQ
ncbi:rhomboid-domain-containing protein [Neoconidiobolus thromboides FSU 785]|nr:rhomboid-domain-containing protein [Neoconidiobolus thromboides FSU 785]